jgi:hypothetical protein
MCCQAIGDIMPTTITGDKIMLATLVVLDPVHAAVLCG